MKIVHVLMRVCVLVLILLFMVGVLTACAQAENLLPNWSFENEGQSGNEASFWSQYDDIGYTRSSERSFDGNYSMRVSRSEGDRISSHGLGGAMISLNRGPESGTIEIKSRVYIEEYVQGNIFSAHVGIHQTDGTTVWKSYQLSAEEIQNNIGQWREYTLNASSAPGKAISGITFWCLVAPSSSGKHFVGTVYYDAIELKAASDDADIVYYVPPKPLADIQVVGNVPSGKYLVLDINVDTDSFKEYVKGEELNIVSEVLNADGMVFLYETTTIPAKDTEMHLDYSELPFGNYTLKVSVCLPNGQELATCEKDFEHVGERHWITGEFDAYETADRVLKPWTPIEYGEQEVSVWGRTVQWSEKSILPSQILTQNIKLLSGPMEVVVTINKRDYVVPLHEFEFVSKNDGKGFLVAYGEIADLKVKADMWIEFDGFLWIELSFEDLLGDRQVDGMYITAPIQRQAASLYQTFSRRGYGWIGSGKIAISWYSDASGHIDPSVLEAGNEMILDFYHWLGNEDLGLGFTYTTLEHWYPESLGEFASIVPGSDVVTYRMNVIERPVSIDGRQYRFGIQATPIKPLPPDYHSMVVTSMSYDWWRPWQRMPENIDFLLTWPAQTQDGIMPGLNAPYKLDADRMLSALEYGHGKGVGVTHVAVCPQKITPYSDDFDIYKLEWMALPESVFLWDESGAYGTGVEVYQNCAGSRSLLEWLFTGYTRNVERFGLDGIYFDGWLGGQMACYNPHHGCGWVDEQGNRRPTVPVLEGREFNKRLAMWLEDNVKSPHVVPESAPEREGFPRYRLMIHSFEFVPSVMGFATDWLTGEFYAYPVSGPSMLTPEGTYGKQGMALFRARALSTNWGVPNFFYPVMWEHGVFPSSDKQTSMAFAWFLPHGVPVGGLDYMNRFVVNDIYEVLTEFETRKANFVPGWRENPFLTIESPVMREVMVATWDHYSENRVLAVVSNLTVTDEHEITLLWKGFLDPKIRDARTGEQLNLEKGRLTVKLGPESFILLWIEE